MRSLVTHVEQSSRGGLVRGLVLLAFALLSTTLSASPAHAAAVVLRLSASQTDVFPIDGYFCLPDAVGTATQTETSTGQVVETDAGVFIFHGVDAYDLHIVFADGTYVQSGLNRDLISFVLKPPLTVFTRATQDLETIYSAQGQPIGKIEIHEIAHLTYSDLNGNGQPDDGEVKVQFDRFRLRCA